MSVVTGLRAKAETESRVNFILAGEDEGTGVRLLSDGRNVRAKKKQQPGLQARFPDSRFFGSRRIYFPIREIGKHFF